MNARGDTPLRLTALTVDSPPSTMRRAAATAPPALILALVLVTALALLLGACGRPIDTSSGTPTTSFTDQPRQGGTLTLAYRAEPSSLDPAVARNAIDRQIVHDVYQGFLRYAPASGEAGTELVACLATEVPTVENGGISPDGRTYIFHLREGVKFQPPVNREVTAKDFKYSFERMLREPGAPGRSFYTSVVGAVAYRKGKADEVTGYRVVDDSTVAITLKRPDLSFLNAMAMDFCDVVPKEWVDQWGEEFDRHPLGTGPFVFQRWAQGEEIVLTRNPQYWEAGRPYLDGVHYQLSFDPSTALVKLEHGEVDVLGDGVPSADLARVQADPKLERLLHSQPLVATSYLFMNVRMKPFNDVKVRRALSWAIDRDRLVDLQAGQAKSLWQFYPEGLPGHEAGKVYYGYDPAKARRLLAAAGYPKGFKTTLYTDNIDPDPAIWRSVQADLAAVGVQASLRTLDTEALYEQQSSPKTLAAGSAWWSMDFPDPSDWIAPLFTKASAAKGGRNASFWWSPKLERMYAAAQRTIDAAARIAAFTEIQEYLAEQAPYVPCYQPVETTMASENTGGFYLHPVYQIDPTQYWRQ